MRALWITGAINHGTHVETIHDVRRELLEPTSKRQRKAHILAAVTDLYPEATFQLYSGGVARFKVGPLGSLEAGYLPTTEA